MLWDARRRIRCVAHLSGGRIDPFDLPSADDPIQWEFRRFHVRITAPICDELHVDVVVVVVMRQVAQCVFDAMVEWAEDEGILFKKKLTRNFEYYAVNLLLREWRCSLVTIHNYGAQVNWFNDARQQRALYADHIPAGDFIGASHRVQWLLLRGIRWE